MKETYYIILLWKKPIIQYCYEINLLYNIAMK